jgi:uncharacterized protein YbcI
MPVLSPGLPMVQQEHPSSAQRSALADITTGIIQLFRKYYGRGPTKGKTYLMDDRYVLCVLEDTMTTVEKTLAKAGDEELVRKVRLAFQEELTAEFTAVVEKALGRKVIAYHSQLVTDPDLGFELFALE